MEQRLLTSVSLTIRWIGPGAQRILNQIEALPGRSAQSH